MKNIKHIILFSLAIFISLASLNAQNSIKATKLIRSGNAEYSDSNFIGSEEKYQLALLEDKDNFDAKYNLANTLFKQERYEEAVEAFEDLIEETPDKTMKANIYHNLANSKLANKDLEGAIEDYKNALRLKPDMQDTRYNLLYAINAKDQQDKQEQKDNKDKDKDKGDKDKDKEEDKDKGDKDKEEQVKEEKQKINKKETERLLRAVAEKEKETKENLEKKKARIKVSKTEKDW